jgi:hypothetical protein
MWPFTLLKKLSQDPPVGKARGDYIGCYLMGTRTPGRKGEDEDISYISLATTREALAQDAHEYLQDFLQRHPQLSTAERDAIASLLAQWDERIDAHLASGTRQPLAVQGGTELFLRTGMRARRKEKGTYLE